MKTLSDLVPATQQPVLKASPKDKPLPSPPIAQVDDSSIVIEAKSLIDASDKPLIRRTPPGKPKPDEDWPVLHPEQRSSTGNLEEMLRETGSQLTQQAMSVEKERYPVLGNTVRQVASDDQLPLSRYSVSYNLPPEVTSTPNNETEAEGSSVAGEDIRRHSDPFKDGIYDSGPVVPAKDLVPSPLKPSARAACVQKPIQDPKSVPEPRQTRTSSLRARLSAAQLEKNSPTKDSSVRDLRLSNELIKGDRDSLLALKEAKGRRSTTPAANKSVSKKGSRDSIGSNRAPAHFVGGSRRPAHPRRPNSRGSHRDEYRVPSPPLPPNRPAPAKPVSRGEGDRGKDVAKGQAGPDVKPRKSSIPVPSMVIDRTAQDGGKVVTPERKNLRFQQARKEARDEVGGIYQDHTFADPINVLQDTQPPATYNDRIPELLPHNHEPRVLEAIEESPQHTYQFKRLSVAAPKYGPTLKISPSAERYIMGSEEDLLLNNMKSKELEDRLKSKPSSSATPIRATKKDNERPSSSQGLSRLSSRVGLIDPKVRERKAKSVDLGQVSPYRTRTNSVQSTNDPRYQNAESSGKVTKSSADASNDPFFDAPEELLCGLGDEVTTTEAQKQCENIDEAAWISPLEKKTSRSSSLGRRDLLALDDYLPGHVQRQSTGDMERDNSKGHRKTDMTPPPNDTSSQNHDIIVKDFAPQSVVSRVGPAKHNPSTPAQTHGKQLPRHGYPPRNSSRTSPPDFISPKNHNSNSLISKNSRTLPANSDSTTPESTSPTAEKKPTTPPKDSVKELEYRRKNPGLLEDFDSSRVNSGVTASKDDSARHDPTNRDSITKRDSAARDSHKSQNSMSKGVLSNFRGLFHKRSSNESLKPNKKSSKSKISIDANGSPFPPISEVHPIHRPTVASAARARTTTPTANNLPSTPATTPSFTSPQPTEVSTSTTLAMQLLEAARNEDSSPKKEQLLKLGQFMVHAITQARDAEKAMEEAKQASRKAEVASALCKRSLGEVEKMVKGCRNEMVNGKGFL